MTSYILILFVTVGMMSDKDSMAITSIPGFSKVSCEQAGKIAVAKFGTGTKRAEFVCVEHK